MKYHIGFTCDATKLAAITGAVAGEVSDLTVTPIQEALAKRSRKHLPASKIERGAFNDTVLSKLTATPMHISDLQAAVERDGGHGPSVNPTLTKLVANGKARRDRRGLYSRT